MVSSLARRRRQRSGIRMSDALSSSNEPWLGRTRLILLGLLLVTGLVSVVMQVKSTMIGRQQLRVGSSSDLFAFVTRISSPAQPEEEDGKVAAAMDPKVLENAPWFDLRKKYFFYQPSGGISNQLLIMESALLICKHLQRTCLLPPIAPHTSGWWNYNGVGIDDVLPVDHVLDMSHLQRVAPVVALQNHTLKAFLRVFENRLGTWRRMNKCPQCTIRKIESTLSNEPAQVLFFGRTSMWQWGKLAKGYQFSSVDTQLVENAVRVSKDLRRIARELSAPMVPYLSIHIRFLDGRDDPRANFDRNANRGAYWKFPLRKPTYFMQELEEAMMLRPAEKASSSGTTKPLKRKKRTLFIATSPKERNSAFFKDFKLRYNATFAGWVEDSRQMKRFMREHHVPNKMASTVLGIVEQLICARSTVFMGTPYSSFSASIRRMRRNRETIADETVSRVQESAVLNEDTRCDNRAKAC